MSDNENVPLLQENETEYKVGKALTEVRRTMTQCIRNMNEMSIRFEDLETETLERVHRMVVRVEQLVQTNKVDLFTYVILFFLTILCIGNAWMLYAESRDRVLFCTQ